MKTKRFIYLLIGAGGGIVLCISIFIIMVRNDIVRQWDTYWTLENFFHTKKKSAHIKDGDVQQIINQFLGNEYLLNGSGDASSYFSPSQPEYYFNYPNSLLLQSLSQFEKSGATYQMRDDLQKVEKLFAQGSDLYSDTDILKKISVNSSFTQKILVHVYQSLCEKFFSEAKQLIKKVIDMSRAVMVMIEQEKKLLTEKIPTISDPALQQCLTEILQTLPTIADNLKNISLMMRGLQHRYDMIYQQYSGDYYQCQLRLEHFSGNNTMVFFEKSLSELGMVHSMMIEALLQGNLSDLAEVCKADGGEDGGQEVDEMLKKLMEDLQKLERSHLQSGSGQDPLYDQIDPKKYDEHYQQLEKDSIRRINEMVRLRSNPSYNVKGYINELFIDFFGNIK